MLYERIKRAEIEFPLFNHQSLTPEDLVSWCGKLGLEVREDRFIQHCAIINVGGDRLILINPDLPRQEQVMALGHEIGHHLLGHDLDGGILHYNHQNMWTRDGGERAASVFGFLSLIPKPVVFRLARTHRLTTLNLYNEMMWLWDDGNTAMDFNICKRRIEIFEELTMICGAKCIRKPGSCKYCDN